MKVRKNQDFAADSFMHNRQFFEYRSLAAHQVDIWYYADQKFPIPEAATDLLDKRESNRYVRSKAAGKRREFLIGRLFCKQVLSQYLDLPAAQIQFELSPNKKPLISNSNWVFNLSHSYGHYVCAVGYGNLLGVDIEYKKRRLNEGYASSVFTPYELAGLHSQPASYRKTRFFHIWTLKEAVWKALDAGPSLAFADFGFGFDPLHFQSPVATGLPWTFDLKKPAPDVQIALAVAADVKTTYFAYQGSLWPAIYHGNHPIGHSTKSNAAE